MEVHEFNKIIPAMTREEYTELRADIKAHGVIQAILLYEDKILDGGHRWKAANETGQECPTETFEGTRDEAIDRVVSLNVNRRHLSDSQKALLGADIATLKRGAPEGNLNASRARTKPPRGGFVSREKVTTAQAAKTLGIGARSIERAKTLKREAPAKVVAEVRAGTKTVATALREVRRNSGKATPAKPVRKGPVLSGSDDLERIAVEHGLPADAFSARSQTTLSIPIKKEHLKRFGTAAKLQGSSPVAMLAEFVATNIAPTEKPEDNPRLPAARLDQIVLTREQVDPDFKGTDLEFTRKYGHVNLHTKDQIDKEKMLRRGDAVVVALKDFVAAVPPNPTTADLLTWLAHDRPATRQDRLQERIKGFRAYLQQLLPVLAQVESQITGKPVEAA